MRYLSYFISFFVHPIWIPIYGAMVFLSYIPVYLPMEEIRATWLSLLLGTVALPALIYSVLFMVGWMNNPFIIVEKKGKWLLYGYIAVLLLVAFIVVPIEKYPILYFYVMNLAISCFLMVFLQYIRFYGNPFCMGIGALTCFAVLLSISHEIDMTYLVAGLLFANGLCFSAQQYLTRQSALNLLLSWLIGAVPQLSLIYLFRNMFISLYL